MSQTSASNPNRQRAFGVRSITASVLVARCALVLAAGCVGVLAASCLTACGATSEEESVLRRQAASSIQSSRTGVAPTAGASGNPQGVAGSSGLPGTGGAGTVAPPREPMPLPEPIVPVDPNSIAGLPQECNGPDLMYGIYGTPAPASGVMIDFTTYTVSGTWGSAAQAQLTGGTSLYSGAPEADLVQRLPMPNSLPVGDDPSAVRLQATVPVGGYTGVVFWFGPCVNASQFGGLAFDATGDLAGATMQVKVQISPNYPVDTANTKGKCQYTSTANQFTDCVQPFLNLMDLSAGTFSYPWSAFTGGVPRPDVDPSQLLGLEFQFQCPGAATAPCAIDMSLSGLTFTPLAEAAP